MAARIDPIIREGQSLERSLTEKLDKTIRAPIQFEATDTLIADKGETITSDHITRVQAVVKARLDEIEAAGKEKRNRELERITMQIEKVKAESDLAMAELRDAVDDDGSTAREQLDADRDELTAMAPMIFLGESRFRELKAKWGQVFRADMGAEAFYEILQRLDLDALAKELWEESARRAASSARRRRPSG